MMQGRLCLVRPYRPADAKAICAIADDFMVARWMTRAFPHPYTQRDADDWIALATSDTAQRYCAIEVDGSLAGGVGIEPYNGERDGTAAFGYWLGRVYWGRGIATEAARMLADRALASGRLRRLEACVFAENVASARVLEKCGFTRDGRLREFYLDRSGKICDAVLFARLASK